MQIIPVSAGLRKAEARRRRGAARRGATTQMSGTAQRGLALLRESEKSCRRRNRHEPCCRTRAMRAATTALWLLLVGCGSRTGAVGLSGPDTPGAAGPGGEAGADGGPDATADGYESTVDVWNPNGPLGHCSPGKPTDQCPSSSLCVEGCPSQGPAGGVCSVPGRESCGCGVVLQPCTTPGLNCLMPSCCDYEGLCVTPEEQATICAGPDAVRFQCALAHSGG